MSRIKKINISEQEGRSPYSEGNGCVLPNGSLVLYKTAYDDSAPWVLRVHDGVTDGGKSVADTGNIVLSGNTISVAQGNLALNGENYVTINSTNGNGQIEIGRYQPGGNIVLGGPNTPIHADGSLKFPDNTTQTTAWVGLPDTITVTSIESKDGPATGATAVSGHPSSGYGNALGIFADGDFTQGSLSSVQVGWTVADNFGWSATVIERGAYGYAGAITLNQQWSSQPPYTYYSQDYVAAAPQDLLLVADTKTLTLKVDGRLVFPNGGSLRVGTVPGSSTGAIGNKAGTLAFDNSHIYYCVEDFGGTSYDVVHGVAAETSANGVDSGYLVSNSYQAPQVGWKLYYNGEVRTIDQVNNGGIPGYYVVFVSSQLTIPGQASLAWGPAPATHNWKRVSWSTDTW